MGLGSSSESTSSILIFFFLSLGNLNFCLEPIINIHGGLYRILDTVGQGSEATVYRCEDQSATQYAVKVFYYSRFSPATMPKRIESFKKEARILKYLSQRSRHFVQLIDYEYKPDENVGYMIMELADGSLRDQLVGAPLDDGLRKFYWKQIVTILRELQDAQVVHADIKPDNMVMVDNVIKVTDLGLAFRMALPRQSMQRPRVRGTLGMSCHFLFIFILSFSFFYKDYMAPEIFHHQTGFKSDIWSAAIILYEMTFGRPPYFSIADRRQKVAAIASRVPIQFPGLRDRYLLDIMRRCLQPDLRVRPNAYQLQAHPYTRM